jgi:hypothetical protein
MRHLRAGVPEPWVASIFLIGRIPKVNTHTELIGSVSFVPAKADLFTQYHYTVFTFSFNLAAN